MSNRDMKWSSWASRRAFTVLEKLWYNVVGYPSTVIMVNVKARKVVVEEVNGSGLNRPPLQSEGTRY